MDYDFLRTFYLTVLPVDCSQHSVLQSFALLSTVTPKLLCGETVVSVYVNLGGGGIHIMVYEFLPDRFLFKCKFYLKRNH